MASVDDNCNFPARSVVPLFHSVLSVDPGTSNLGWAVLGSDGKLKRSGVVSLRGHSVKRVSVDVSVTKSVVQLCSELFESQGFPEFGALVIESQMRRKMHSVVIALLAYMHGALGKRIDVMAASVVDRHFEMKSFKRKRDETAYARWARNKKESVKKMYELGMADITDHNEAEAILQGMCWQQQRGRL